MSSTILTASPLATGSMMHSGLKGLHSNMTGLTQVAGQIVSVGQAESSVTTGSLAQPLVELKLYEVGAKAAARVIKSADEMMGTLLDTFA